MNTSLKIGTTGGTALTLLSISSVDIERTLVLGALGAAVSFLVSYGLKILLEKKKPPQG